MLNLEFNDIELVVVPTTLAWVPDVGELTTIDGVELNPYPPFIISTVCIPPSTIVDVAVAVTPIPERVNVAE